LCKLGNKYAKVFPLPVCALHDTSKPFNVSGIDRICACVGRSKFRDTHERISRSSSPNCSHVVVVVVVVVSRSSFIVVVVQRSFCFQAAAERAREYTKVLLLLMRIVKQRKLWRRTKWFFGNSLTEKDGHFFSHSCSSKKKF
jgi:hypothetical protein